AHPLEVRQGGGIAAARGRTRTTIPKLASPLRSFAILRNDPTLQYGGVQGAAAARPCGATDRAAGGNRGSDPKSFPLNYHRLETPPEFVLHLRNCAAFGSVHVSGPITTTSHAG